MNRTFLAAGAMFALLAVAAGAFGAHALGPGMTAAHSATYETAVRYQMYHALALCIIALACAHMPDPSLLEWAGRLFLAGIVIFSSTLYIIALGGPRWLGAITPLGGLCFLAGWGAVALAAWRMKAR